MAIVLSLSRLETRGTMRNVDSFKQMVLTGLLSATGSTAIAAVASFANPSFENGTFTSSVTFAGINYDDISTPNFNTSVTSWAVNSSTASNQIYWMDDGAATIAKAGNRFVYLAGSQVINTPADTCLNQTPANLLVGTSYCISIWASNAGSTTSGTVGLGTDVKGILAFESNQPVQFAQLDVNPGWDKNLAGTGAPNWQEITFIYTPTVLNQQIWFSTGVKPTDAIDAFTSRIVIDNISIVVCVPETSSVVAGLAMMAGMGWTVARRQKNIR